MSGAFLFSMEISGEGGADLGAEEFLVPINAGPTLETLFVLSMPSIRALGHARAQCQRTTRTGSDLSLFVYAWDRVDTASLPIDRRCVPFTR